MNGKDFILVLVSVHAFLSEIDFSKLLIYLSTMVRFIKANAILFELLGIKILG